MYPTSIINRGCTEGRIEVYGILYTYIGRLCAILCALRSRLALLGGRERGEAEQERVPGVDGALGLAHDARHVHLPGPETAEKGRLSARSVP